MSNVVELRIKTVSHRIGFVLVTVAILFAAGLFAVHLLFNNPRPAFHLKLSEANLYALFCTETQTDEICLKHQDTTPEQFAAIEEAFDRRQEGERAQAWDAWHRSNWSAGMLTGLIMTAGGLGYAAVRSLGWIISGAFAEH